MLLCCVSGISAVSDDVINVSEMDSGDVSVSVIDGEQVVGVDDSASVTQESSGELSRQSDDRQVNCESVLSGDVSDDLDVCNVENALSLSEDSSMGFLELNLTNDVLNSQYSLNGGTFKDIQDLVDNAGAGDTIILNGDFYAEDGSSTVTIDKKLTITSSNSATLDGKDKARIFNIKSDANNLVISNIVFKNGYDEKRGGAIYINASNVVIDGCVFQCCFANS